MFDSEICSQSIKINVGDNLKNREIDIFSHNNAANRQSMIMKFFCSSKKQSALGVLWKNNLKCVVEVTQI